MTRGVLVVCAAALLAPAPSSAPAAVDQSRMTIIARPTVIEWGTSAQLAGVAPGATHLDVVTIQVRECGSSSFRTFVEVHLLSGGGWSTPAGSAVTATYRAAWRGRTSASVTIRQRADVRLERKRAGDAWVVSVIAKRSVWRKVVLIQRRQGGGWQTLRRVVLSESPGSTGAVSVSQATFRLGVPTGTALRAVLPAAEARPCYVQSISRTARA